MPPPNSETQSPGAKRKRRGSAGPTTVTRKRSIKASDDIKTTTNVPATATYDVNAKITPHKLCAVCTATVSKSQFLNNRISDIDITLSSTGYTERWEHFAHHSSLEVLKASARYGCHLCTRLCNIVNEKSVDQVIEDDQKRRKMMFPIQWKVMVLGPYLLSM
jgi:hypothetical protein